MKFKDCQFIPKNRRGLSTIVGALLFVVLMVATFSVLGIALNSQTDIVQTSRDVTDLGLAQQQEDFDLVSITQAAGDDLEVDLINNGQNAAEMFTMIMTNKSDAGEPTQTFEIPSGTSFLAPGAELPTDIVQTLNITMNTPTVNVTETYDFKVISSLGTIKKLRIECTDDGVCGPLTGSIGEGALSVQLFLDGPTGINGKTSTIIMFVQNTGDATILDVEPVLTCAAMTTTVPVGGDHTFTGCEPPTPASITELPGGAVGIFKYDGLALCDVGDVYKFENAVQGDGVPDSNFDDDTLECIDPNDCGPGGCGGEGGETIILIDDLLIKPSLFLTIPSPYGGVSAGDPDDSAGIWGVQVANPLNFTIGVSKVTITAFAPGANSNLVVFDKGANENHNVSPRFSGIPDDVGDWFAGAENVLVWTNISNPIVLGPYQSESFLYSVNPFHNGQDLEAIIVQTSIFSTSGSFGKAAYQTTMFDATGPQNAPIGNVYLSTTVDSTDSADMRGHRNNMINGTSADFIVVMSDMDQTDQSWIKQNSEFIINVPREWSQPSLILVNTTKIIVNATQPSIIKHSDGSWQIIGLLSEDIGDQNSRESATISFSTTAPEERVERLYIMYVLGNGLTNADKSVGPLSEIILHVIGNVTGY